MNFNRLLFALTLGTFLSACDGLTSGNRFDVAKDNSGRTLRIDKKTGDISVVEEDKIVPLRMAKEGDDSRSEQDALAKPKNFPEVTVKHMAIRAGLVTSWQDGKVYYSIDLKPFLGGKTKSNDQSADVTKGEADKKPAAEAANSENRAAAIALFKASMLQRTFTLLMEDLPFELVRENLRLSYVVDDNGEVVSYNGKGQLAMSKEIYKRVDAWNINWR